METTTKNILESNYLYTINNLRESILIKTPYNADFISDLKSQIPSRKWHKNSKQWEVDLNSEKTVIELIEKHYPKNIKDEKSTQLPTGMSQQQWNEDCGEY